MYKIKLYNNIAPIGINAFDERYDVSEDMENEDAILVRSANLFDIDYNPNLKSIARAGAGVNNIDIDTCTKKESLFLTHQEQIQTQSRNLFSQVC